MNIKGAMTARASKTAKATGTPPETKRIEFLVERSKMCSIIIHLASIEVSQTYRHSKSCIMYFLGPNGTFNPL